MATLNYSLCFLECDGCGAVFGTPAGYVSPMDLRAEAYAEGWRFPPHSTGSGKPANTTSDACPECCGNWRSQKRLARSRIISQQVARGLISGELASARDGGA